MKKNRKIGKSSVLSSNIIQEQESSLGRIVDPLSTGNQTVERDSEMNYFDYQMKFNLTARIINSQWQIKDFSLLLDTLNYEIAISGCSFEMYLTVELLLTILIGQKSSYWDIKDEKVRLTCLSTSLILRDLRGEFYQWKTKLELSDKTLKYLRDNNLIITKRIYSSRKEYYYAERFIEIRAVPVEQSLERRQGSERYSGYCKGYGEGGSTAPRKKTRPSTELDGDTEDIPLRFSLLEMSKYQSILFLEYIQKIVGRK
jgi:hypothetical protein